MNDLISLEAAKQAMKNLCDPELGQYDENPHIDAILGALDDLPYIDGEDSISREQVLIALDDFDPEIHGSFTLYIRDMPSAFDEMEGGD